MSRVSSRSTRSIPFTVPAVPTGMNTGVSTGPWGRWRRPRRAPAGSVARSSKRAGATALPVSAPPCTAR